MYKNPEGIEEFFDYLSELEERRTDEESPLYCKIVEWHRDSFIHHPAVCFTINKETLKVIKEEMRKLKLTGDFIIEDEEETNFNCILSEINSVEI
jgi:hypothetical protein